MAKIKVNGEQPIQILSHSFSVSPSSSGYDLQYSADGIDYTTYDESVPADETLVVNGVAFGQFVRFSGNTDEVTVIY